MSYLKCPECQKKGVRHVLKAHGEDGYICRYCSFHAFTIEPEGVDEERLTALARVNPTQQVLNARPLPEPLPSLLRDWAARLNEVHTEHGNRAAARRLEAVISEMLQYAGGES